MAILDFLTGREGLERQRRLADRFVEEAYNTDAFSPVLEEARVRATEGIQEEPIRTEGLKRIFASTQTPMINAGQGGSLAALQQFDQARMSALADLEGQVGIMDEQAMQEGRSSVANILSQIRQTRTQRNAALAQNRLDIEAESQRRKMGLIGGIAKLGISAGLAQIPGLKEGLGGILDSEEETGSPAAYNYEFEGFDFTNYA